MEDKCNHFWEVVFPITDTKNQEHKCMICGTTENREIPILNIEK